MTKTKWLLLLMSVLFSFDAVKGQKVSISSTYSLVLYEWVENPLLIVVENNDCKNIVVKASAGKLTGSNGEYVFVLADTGFSRIVFSVGIKKGNKTRWIQKVFCRVKKLPTPPVTVSHQTDGDITKELLLAIPQLFVPHYFGWEATYAPNIQRVTSYSIKISRNDSTLFEQRDVPGDTLTQEMEDFIRYQCKAKDVLVFSDIQILLYKKERRRAENSVTLYLTGPD
jgi:hypothetical protein